MDQIKKERPDIATKFESLMGKASMEETLAFQKEKH
jgi:hypothetical protein